MKKQSWIAVAVVLGSLSLGACGGSSSGGGDDSAGNGGGNGGDVGNGGGNGGDVGNGGGNGGNGGNGGGDTITSRDKAAASGVAAALLPKFSSDFADDVSDDDGSTQSLQTKQQDQCNDGGSLETSEFTADVGSPFASQLDVVRIEADNCRNSSSGGGFSVSSRQDGILEVGSAENERVTYIFASDLGGDPDSGEPFVSETSGSGFPNSSIEQRASLNVCDGCSSPTQGGTQEIVGFLAGSFDFGDGERFDVAFGESTENGIEVIAKDMGATTESTINGVFSFDDGTECSLKADYQTVSPVVTSNSGDGRATSGELNVTIDDGETFNVQFNSDGSAIVNGRTYTVQELDALEDACVDNLDQQQSSS